MEFPGVVRGGIRSEFQSSVVLSLQPLDQCFVVFSPFFFVLLGSPRAGTPQCGPDCCILRIQGHDSWYIGL